VNQERQLSFAEFAALPRVRVASDIHCVTGWSRLDNIWEGVGSETVGELSMVHPEARFVIVHGFGGFTTNLSRDDFFQPDVLLALSHDGRTLTPEHGYPVRLVVPRLYFWKSAKWVTGLRFVAEDRPGFWETRGYHNRGDPWREERYSL
jgi:DMSO/TMAO reductase YedYZ molybdopterin-dependent catalytic subunit